MWNAAVFLYKLSSYSSRTVSIVLLQLLKAMATHMDGISIVACEDEALFAAFTEEDD